MPDLLLTPNLIPLHAWLIEAGTNDVATETLFDGFCGRLAAAGVPIARGFLSIAGLHPLRRAYSLTWSDGRIVEVTDFGHATIATGEFRDAGMSEWLALMYGFGWSAAQPATNQFGVVLSWTTSAAVGRGNGWSAMELAAIEELSGTLALAIKGNTAPSAAHDLLAAYLGGDAADRVSAGQVQRGSVSRIAAAILYADVRGFTNFAEDTAPEEVTRRLNGIFDCLGDPVRAAGGEILKFLGDGVLAVFLPPDGANVAVVTPAALAAAREILARVEALNATEAAAGNPALGLDIALHAGEVTYGNIGTADRLDFTVIGPAVNEAARLEGLCKVLGKPVLISTSFVQAAQGARELLSSVGRHPLRGVREPQDVFTICT